MQTRRSWRWLTMIFCDRAGIVTPVMWAPRVSVSLVKVFTVFVALTHFSITITIFLFLRLGSWILLLLLLLLLLLQWFPSHLIILKGEHLNSRLFHSITYLWHIFPPTPLWILLLKEKIPCLSWDFKQSFQLKTLVFCHCTSANSW